MNERFAFEMLGAHHRRTSFSCGEEGLDRYLQQQAGQEQRSRVSFVYILQDLDTQAVAGYYTLSAASVLAAELPANARKRLPRYPALPAILIGRLAVDLRYQGQHLGEVLLLDALARIFVSNVAATFVIVDALHERVRGFYARYGFMPFPEHELRLFLPTASIVSELAPGP